MWYWNWRDCYTVFLEEEQPTLWIPITIIARYPFLNQTKNKVSYFVYFIGWYCSIHLFVVLLHYSNAIQYSITVLHVYSTVLYCRVLHLFEIQSVISFNIIPLNLYRVNVFLFWNCKGSLHLDSFKSDMMLLLLFFNWLG